MKKRISDLLTVLMSLIAYVILSPNFSFVAFADGGTEFNPGWPFATKGYDHYIRVVDNYSPSYSLKEHKGMDIAADIGDEVLAVESGKVVAVVNNKADAYESGSWGNYVKIEHTINGKKYYSLYAHLKKGSVTVNTNDNVKKGDVIGLVGISGASTGPHLHLEMNTGKRWTQSFEYYKDSSAINGVWFNSNSRNYSKHYSQWIKDNCEQIKRGKTTFYVYNGGKVNEPVDPKPDNLNPEISFENRNMIVDVGKGYTLRICSTVNHNKEYAIGSIPNEATVYVYGTTNQQYDNRTWAKISYNGTDGWVNYERPISSPPTPTLIKEYSITFDANGGTGMMAEADMICGVPKSLPANSFYRDGYRFAGWAGSPNGQVEFSDQQMVDLSSVGGVCIGLYAIWEPNFEKPVLSISEHNTPPDQETGDNFGIRGVIQTNCGKITQVRGYILDSGNNPIQTGEYMPDAESIDLQYSINNDLVFGRLPAGSYTYCVEATAVNGDQTTTETLINSSFRVKEKSETTAVMIRVSAEFIQIDRAVSDSAVVAVDCDGTLPANWYWNLAAAGPFICNWEDNNSFTIYPTGTGDADLDILICDTGTDQVVAKKTIKVSIIDSKSFDQDSYGQESTSIEDSPKYSVPVLSISEYNVPSDVNEGTNFGLRGIIQTSSGTITDVWGYLYDSADNRVQSSHYTPGETSHNLRYSINNDIVFGKLSPGNYRYIVEAKAVNGDQTETKRLIDSTFEVKTVSVQQDEPEINAIGKEMRVNVGKGSTLRFCATVSKADAYEIGSIPNGTTVYVYGTTIQEYEDTTWAKIRYDGRDGWVNYKWLS